MTGRQLSEMGGHRYITRSHARRRPGAADTLQKQGQGKQAVQKGAAHGGMIDQRHRDLFRYSDNRRSLTFCAATSAAAKGKRCQRLAEYSRVKSK